MTSALIFSSKSINFLVIGALLSTSLCFAVRWVGLRFRVHSKTSFRREKNLPVPLLGGLGSYLAALGTAPFVGSTLLWNVLLASAPIVITGVLDDVFEISARLKFSSQVLATLLWVGLASPHEVIYTRLGLHPALGGAITVLFLLTLMNAFNFLDGIDGQTGMIALFAFLTLGASDDQMWPTSLVLISAVSGFLYFNLPPAKLYMGEVGSSFLGFAAGAVATTLPTLNNSSWTSFWVINFLFALPFCDLLAATFRRLRRGLGPWHPDREHFHHRLSAIGINGKSAIAITSFIAGISSLVAYQIQVSQSSSDKFVIAFVGGSSLLFIYSSFVVAESVLGRRISVLGRRIIEKYLPLSPLPALKDSNHRCILVDLQSCFSVLQAKGISTVDDFALEFSKWVKSIESLTAVVPIGSYSVALVIGSVPATEKAEKTDWRHSHVYALQELYGKFKLIRDIRLYPDGVTFFDSIQDEKIARLLDQSAPKEISASTKLAS